MPGISGAQTLLASAAYPSLEAQRKELEAQKLILLDKQRDLGDHHPETLNAMESLAWLHYELGEFSSARDLWVTVLETCQIFLGEDDPHTLYTMEQPMMHWVSSKKHRK
jgi:hypothetical protein